MQDYINKKYVISKKWLNLFISKIDNVIAMAVLQAVDYIRSNIKYKNNKKFFFNQFINQ